MKIKIAIAAALLGCQLCALAAGARGEADKRIDALLLAPLTQIAQMDGAAVPNGLPYVPPDQRGVDGGAPFERKTTGRGRRSGSHKRGSKHKKRLSSAPRRRSTTAAVPGPSEAPESCCAPMPAQM